MAFSQEQLELLKGPLNSQFVKPPPKGKFGEYMEGWRAIDEANRIFGHDGWSYDVQTIGETHRELCDLEYNGEEYQQWRVSYVATVTVTAGGVSRCDVGSGGGQAKPANLGDAIESAAKEAVTDALKRALRSFGNPLGLALYDKTKANVADVPEQPEQPEPREPTRAEKLIAQRPKGKRFDSKADSETVLQTHLTAIALAGTQAELKLFGVDNKREIDFLFDDHWADLMITVKQLMSQLPEGHMENAA